jgi:hypothetical protein
MRFAALIIACLLLAPPQQDPRGRDGRYHNPNTGAVQPDHCDNQGSHPCHCARTQAENCDKGAGTSQGEEPGYKCATFCRKDDCRCAVCCKKGDE